MKSINIKKGNLLLAGIGLSLFMLTGFLGCLEDNTITERNWQLTWEDDFDGQTGELPDPTGWNLDLGKGPNGDGWGNNELQTYTDEPENVALDGEGNLVITALNNGGYTSARINTKGLFEQQYGRFEARIKLPYGPGIWPAFWLLGSDIDENPWPACGEIDIMELKGQQPNIIYGTLHGPGYSGGHPDVTKSFGFENDRFDVDFHVFRVDWGEDFIHFYVDDVIYQRLTPEDVPGEWVFDQPFFILLNTAVGGNYVGFPTGNTNFPQQMIIDYVKVYEEAN